MSSMELSRASPRLGIFSIVVALLAGVLWCGWSVWSSDVLFQTVQTASAKTGAATVANSGLVVTGVAVLLAIVGVILGLLSLRHKEQKRGFGIAGLALNGLALVVYLLLFLVGSLITG